MARYPIRNHQPTSQHSVPSPMMAHQVAGGGHPPPSLMSLGHLPPSQPMDRKDYYDSYTRYFCYNSHFIHVYVLSRKFIDLFYVDLIPFSEQLLTSKCHEQRLILLCKQVYKSDLSTCYARVSSLLLKLNVVLIL